DWDGTELEERIGEFDGILIRSATELTGDLIERAERLKVIGRAGTGVDNVDVDAATERGIVVANATEENSIAAAEHTMALMLANSRRRGCRLPSRDLRPRRLHHPAPAEDRGDRELQRRRGDRPDARRGQDRQQLPWRADRPRCAARGPRVGQGRRGRARRLSG